MRLLVWREYTLFGLLELLDVFVEEGFDVLVAWLSEQNAMRGRGADEARLS